MAEIMSFCCECNNLLYPKEDREAKELWLVCRLCHYKAKAQNYCIYRHVIKHEAMEKTQYLSDYRLDPTLQRTKQTKCPNCNYNEAVYFQIADKGEDGNSMCLFYVCCNKECSHRWRDGDNY